MIITTREVEPFNIPPVDNHQAGLFTRHLTGKETFSFSGNEKPKSMMIYSLKYNYPRHCFAHAYLLSIDLDQFESICSSGLHPTMEGIMKQYVVGNIELEFGGDIAGVNITATPTKLKF